MTSTKPLISNISMEEMRRILTYEHGESHYDELQSTFGLWRRKDFPASGYRYVFCKGGYFPETMQYALCIQLSKDADTCRAVAEIEEALELIYPLKMDKKSDEKTMDIFEHTLGDYGVYYFVYKPDEKMAKRYSIQHWMYHSLHHEEFFGDLKNTVEYIKENHWYGD